MRCQDCIHEDLCMDKFKKQYQVYANKNITVDDCEHFKNKADYVEVVRCKNCIYFTKERMGDGIESICTCGSAMIIIDPDKYCSYGKRK